VENELFPLTSGVLIGLVLGAVTARRRPWVWAVLSVGLGFVATVVSGEFRSTWAYLLLDIPLVGGTSAAAFLISRTARRRLLSLALFVRRDPTSRPSRERESLDIPQGQE
jgi:hypothetical protein